MARKIVNITHSANEYDILSQTPKNYDKNNYFLKELQDKIDADWDYRPNRVDVEYENQWGMQTYTPIEAVVQSMRSERGTDISNDCKNLVFRNLNYPKFSIGLKFRFSRDYNLESKDKNVWLVTNINDAKITNSVVIERCNGFLGSTYIDSQNVSKYHYEPVIQGKDLSSTGLAVNDVVISPQSQLLIICQHNDFTRNYFINQRFIIGYDKVYRITAINKFYSNSTFNSENVGLMRIYLELTESSEYDNFVEHIAYQNVSDVHIKESSENDNYSIKFITPEVIPNSLSSESISFTPKLYKDGEIVEEQPQFIFDYNLQNLPATVDKNVYINYSENDGVFTISRKRKYLGGDLMIKCYIAEDNSPNQKEISAEFKMLMGK